MFEGDELVAWAQVSEERADADVHPRARRRGIGSALVVWTEQRALQRAPEGSAVRIGQTVTEDLDGLQELFVARGYERLWDSWVLRLPVDIELEARPLPDGVAIRPFRPVEEHAIYTIVDDAFNEWEGRESRPFEDWQANTTARSDFDPQLLLVATVDDVLAGVVVGIHYPGEGWVDQVAVKKEFRNRGIARALLVAIFDEFRTRGESLLGLNTDSRTGALDLYFGIGMVVQHTFTRWSRTVRPGADS